MKTIIGVFTLFAAMASTNGASAQSTRVSSNGHQYALTCNNDGFVLTSLYPVSRAVGSGANTRYATGTEVIYLGKSCDAYSPVLGGGDWCWANGGFGASLGNSGVSFPRQDLDCPSNANLGLECWCQ